MRIVVICAASLIGFIGCEQEPATERVLWGLVDRSLAPEVQSQQDALSRLFRTLQTGTPLRHLGNYEPDIEFQTDPEAFFGEGIQLARWDWSQPPHGNKHFVRMQFLLDEPPGDQLVTYERIYAVSKTGSKFVIRNVSTGAP